MSDLRIGVIGLDTSHCVAFTQVLNDPGVANHVAGARIAAAVKTWSADMEASASRVEGYAVAMRDTFGVKLVPTIEEMCREVDAVVCIWSRHGR